MKKCDCVYCENVRFPYENKHYILTNDAWQAKQLHQRFGDRLLEYDKKLSTTNY